MFQESPKETFQGFVRSEILSGSPDVTGWQGNLSFSMSCRHLPSLDRTTRDRRDWFNTSIFNISESPVN